MRRTIACGLSILVILASPAALGGAQSYQPKSNVTRGIYAHINRVIKAAVWDAWGSGFAFVKGRPHSGEGCIRCIGEAGTRGQGVGQSVELNQTEARPVKIAGWSRCKNVKGQKSYRYSLYVDFVFTDGKPLHMKIATFDTGTHDWQYAETVVKPPKALRSARFHAFIRELDGTVWFDDLFLGEPGGKNLLRCPGFEKENRFDLSRRRKLFNDLKALHCNAVHGYLSGSLRDWDEPPSKDSEIVQFLDAAHKQGIGVWLTIGLGALPIRDASDPSFPQFYCVNGDWGRRWTETLAKVARYPFAALSMVPDEYNWNNHRLKRAYRRHADAKVRRFYAKLGAYCDCPVCRKRFQQAFGKSFPDRVPGPEWLRFRYDSTTDWLRRTCAAVKKANSAIRADSLICVTPICSDFWYGPGIAWDRAGYEAGLEYATTDPYIQLHNYLGDSTHWYVTETTEHLAAASPQRRCGVVLEASRLRPQYREIDPVEIHGSALSAVWHGADELAWWHHTHVMGLSGTTQRAKVSQACVSGVYGLLEKIDPWLDGVSPEPGIAFLFSRASCDLWRLYVQAKNVKPPFNTRGITDPRYASLAQKEVLYYLLRQGFPTTLYYLESVREEELARHRILLGPFPLAVRDEGAKLLERLARSGKRVVVVAEAGALDEKGTPRERHSLLGLLGLRTAPSSVTEWGAALTGTVPVYEKVETEADVFRWPPIGGRPLWVKQKVGKGEVVFLAGDFGAALPLSRDNEKRTRTERIYPSPLNPLAAKVIRNAVEGPVDPPLLGRLPDGDDVELCLSVNRRGEKLFLAINWDSRERAVVLPKRPCFDRPPLEAYCLDPNGQWAVWKGSFRPKLDLKAGEALVARLAGK